MSDKKHSNGCSLDKPLHKMTRRDFLAMGLISSAGYVSLPGLLGLFSGSKDALAEGTDHLLPFLVFDFAGGLAFPRNFLVGKRNGATDLLPSYNQLGGTGGLNTQFGAPMYANSPFLAGLMDIFNNNPAFASAASGLRFGTLCHHSQDDSFSNRHSAFTLVSQVLQGRTISLGLGMDPSASGGHSGVPIVMNQFRPIPVTSIGDVLGAIDPQGPLGALTSGQKQVWARTALALSNAQKSMINYRIWGETFGNQVAAGWAQGMQFVSGNGPNLNPANDPQVASIIATANTLLNIPTCPFAGSLERLFAISYNTIKRNCGPGTLSFGGYDYHSGGNDPSGGDATMDRFAGRLVGSAVVTASLLGMPLMFEMLTDGGSYFIDGVCRGDDGSKSLTVVGYFRPVQAPTFRRTQIGAYTEGQSIDRTTIIGADDSRAAYCVFANYLQQCGRLGDFLNYAPPLFTNQELDQMLIFA